MLRNPFSQLYVGEKIPPGEFVEIFSNELVHLAMPMFEPGNVILSGIQGTGKSMLFKLLQPETRIAYANAGLDLPIPRSTLGFIGAGININNARCNMFGHRRAPAGDYQQELMFADFLNTYVCLDLLRALHLLAEHPVTAAQLEIQFDEPHRTALVRTLAAEQVWQGYYDGIDSLAAFEARAQARLNGYRRYLAGNDLELDPVIAGSKSEPGEPVSLLAGHLRTLRIIPQQCEVFALIDQYEELATIVDPGGREIDYRAVVNAIVNRRDPNLSYRLGTRGYGWRDHMRILGTDALIEPDRDFKLVDLDAKLKRYEDPSTDIFPAFARNVFRRRMQRFQRDTATTRDPIELSGLLGASDSVPEKAKTLAGRNPEAALELDADWPEEAKLRLRELARTDILDAKLLEAWIRQKGWSDKLALAPLPWQSKPYWKKERLQLALHRIAGVRRQRVIYAGEADIITLAGQNILTFLSICQHIWDNAVQAADGQPARIELPVRPTVQTIGVFQSGRWWLDRIPHEYERGDERYRFIQKLGEMFSNLAGADKRMSYPGVGGFSLTLEENEANTDVRQFLNAAVDYGNLVRREHTTRSADKKRRIKFYLNPIYCPIYRISARVTKEPKYVTAQDIRSWMREVGVATAPIDNAKPARRMKKDASGQLTLLDDIDGAVR